MDNLQASIKYIEQLIDESEQRTIALRELRDKMKADFAQGEVQSTGELSINPINFIELKSAYAKAVESEVETFIFQGEELHVGFAKYLIEHIENEIAANFADGSA